MALSIEIPKINYLTGENVSGRVIYHPTSDRVIYGIHIHFTGSEYCDNLPVADIPFQKRWILDGATTVYGNEAAKTREGRFLSHRVNEASQSKGVVIKAGEYNFPFTFQIPQNVPPSCSYKNGKVKIEYLVEAIVEIPWSRSVRSSKILKVGIPYYLEPEKPLQYVRAEKSFIFHNTPGNYARPHLLKVESCVDKLVTYSGDKLSLTVHVDNNSGRSIGAIKVKLKQTWTTGIAGIWEKFTISKAKYKDSHFPLGQGKHRVLIPMVIPALETRPTVQNASLIRCVYHVTLKISFRMSGDLRVRLPIILSTFPPKIRSPNSNSSLTIAELPTTDSQPPPTKVITFNWDDTSPEQRTAVLPEIQPINPMQPLPSETSEMGPSLNISDFMDVSHPAIQAPSAPEMLYSERIKQISTDRQLTLESSTPVDNPHLSIEKASSILQESTKNLLQALSKLIEAANSNDFSTYAVLGKRIEEELDNLFESASFTSNSSRSPSDQQAIQMFAREIADNVMQVLTEVELKMKNASSGTISNSNSNQLADSVQNVRSVLNKLLECSRKVIDGSRDFKGQMNEIKEVLNKLLMQFNNPFGDSHSDAKMSDVITSTSTFEKRVQTLIEGLPGPRDETLKNASHAADALCELMLDSKGVAKQHSDSFATHLVEVVRKSTGTLMRLIDSSMVYETNGVVPQIVNSQWKDIQSYTTEINNLILTKQDALELQKKKLPKPPQVEDRISSQLCEAMESLTAATEKLNLVKESQPANLQVLSETHSVAAAIRQLLDASQKAQKERTSKITAGRFYHVDPTWSDGLVSAAKQVVVLVQQLVNICSEKEIKMEIVVSLARAISATTAQLIIADRAKTDPKSQSHDLLVKAARAVALATDELLKAAEKNAKEEEIPTVDEKNGTLIGERIKELEASANIAKLEKQLEKARLQLGDIRKQQYTGK